jgi:hypothetical protein
MTWMLIRVVIFSVALLIGLLLGSGVTPSDPQVDVAQVGRDINEPQCERNERNTFVLVRAGQDRFPAMR